MSDSGDHHISTKTIFLQFLKIGFIAFGGPAAHAALMEQELVSRKKWLTTQTFLDYLGSVNLIPGPNSTQLTMLVGYKLKGFAGMVAGGFGFILPAAMITGLLAMLYVRMGEVPAIGHLFYGIKPAVIAVILGAIYKLGGKAMKNWWLTLLGFIVLASTLAGLNEITAILGAGALGMAAFTAKKGFSGQQNAGAIAPFLLLNTAVVAGTQYTTLKLFWIFFKIGALLFGTGYVLIAYMDGELVEKAAWITREQLLDAIAIGQFTPGPILSAATFTGYLLDGWKGAMVATAGIFLPSFFFILVLFPFIPRLRKSPHTAAFLDSVNMAAVAVMLSVSISMSVDIITDWGAGLIMILALVAVFGPGKPGAIWIIFGGAILGLIINIF